MEIGRYRGQYGRMQIQEVEKDELDKIRERLDVCLSCSHVHCTAIASHLHVELDRWPEREQCMLPVICIHAIYL